VDKAERFTAEKGWTALSGWPPGIGPHSIMWLPGAIAIENEYRSVGSEGRAVPDSERGPHALFQMP